MRFLRVLGIFMFLMSICAVAAPNNLGIHEVSQTTFDAPTRIGTVLMPAGDYTIRHSMEGQDHVMAFQRKGSSEVFKVKCTLVQLAHKADRDQKVYEVTSGSEKILHELVFRGDTAKHVF